MAASWDSPHDLDRLVVCCVQLFRFWTEKIPQNRAGETTVPNGINAEFSLRMSEVKLLADLIIFSNILGSFLFDILMHNILVCDYFISNVFTRILPG